MMWLEVHQAMTYSTYFYSSVKEILTLCPHEKLLSLYKMPSFTSVDDFLQKLATLRGKLKKGGIVDVEAAAKIVLHDWNDGTIDKLSLINVVNLLVNFKSSHRFVIR